MADDGVVGTSFARLTLVNEKSIQRGDPIRSTNTFEGIIVSDTTITEVTTGNGSSANPGATFELAALNSVLAPDAPGAPIISVLTLQGKNGYSGLIALDIGRGLPVGVEAVLNPMEISLTPESPLQPIQLQLNLPDGLAPGDYAFAASAFATDGSQFQRLPLTLKIELPEVVPAFLTTAIDPSPEILFADDHQLFGSLVAEAPEGGVNLEDHPIGITLTAPSGRIRHFEVRTGAGGRYQLENPFLLDEVGEWRLNADFSGNARLGSARSVPLVFNVIKGQPRIGLEIPEVESLGAEIEIIGTLEPPLEGEPIILRILRPDASASTLADAATAQLGVFRRAVRLNLAGDWSFTATWAGNDNYDSVSETMVIRVRTEVGKAILVLGGGDRQSNPNWDRFNSLASYVRRILLNRQFDDVDDIHFLSPDPIRTAGADGETSVNSLRLAITRWAREQVNPQVPLYLYLLSHNLGDQFLLVQRRTDETFLSPDQLAEWLNELPEGTPVTIVMEACHSGNFITQTGAPSALVGPNRTIITSARADKQAKILGNRDSFSKAFFDRVQANKTVSEAFREAERLMRQTPVHRDQFPQLDANGNGVPNEAQDFAAVASRYFPADITSLAAPPQFIALSDPLELGVLEDPLELGALEDPLELGTLEKPQKLGTLPEGVSSLTIQAELLGADITRVFATVVPPNFDPTRRIDDWNALSFDEFNLVQLDDREYAGAYHNFTLPGDYTIIVNAENPDGSSDSVQTVVTVPGEVQVAWDVNADGGIDVFDLVFVASQFGQHGAGLKGDVNGDGTVDVSDLVLVGSHFGEHTIAASPSARLSRAHRGALGFVPASRQETAAIQQALAELEGLRDRSRGAEVARQFLRAWLTGASPIVTETKLLPNYPNPFNPETWIPYELEKEADVTIEIYNVSGQLVRTLDLGIQSRGRYISREKAAYWDGRTEYSERAASGVYFYLLRVSSVARSRESGTGDFTETRRMVILK